MSYESSRTELSVIYMQNIDTYILIDEVRRDRLIDFGMIYFQVQIQMMVLELGQVTGDSHKSEETNYFVLPANSLPVQIACAHKYVQHIKSNDPVFCNAEMLYAMEQLRLAKMIRIEYSAYKQPLLKQLNVEGS